MKGVTVAGTGTQAQVYLLDPENPNVGAVNVTGNLGGMNKFNPFTTSGPQETRTWLLFSSSDNMMVADGSDGNIWAALVQPTDPNPGTTPVTGLRLNDRYDNGRRECQLDAQARHGHRLCPRCAVILDRVDRSVL